MSDNFLKLIPVDPWFTPSRSAAEEAEDLARVLMKKFDRVERQVFEETQFFDCGSFFERVECPGCGGQLTQDFWGELMRFDWSTAAKGFLLRVQKLCNCGFCGTLNDLNYFQEQAFGRFCIAVMNPGEWNFRTEDLQRIEKTLCTRLRQIVQHL
jgi:hypothetical protein